MFSGILITKSGFLMLLKTKCQLTVLSGTAFGLSISYEHARNFETENCEEGIPENIALNSLYTPVP